MNKKTVHQAFGFSLIEVLLGLTLFAIFSAGIFYAAFDAADSDLRQEFKSEALNYAQEGLEATRMIRNVDFLELTSGNHGVVYSAGAWSFSGTSDVIDSFYTRTVTISDVYRDASNNIADTGLLDPMTKKVISTVSWTWKGYLPQSVDLTTYFTDWSGDQWTQTTCAEFALGTYSSMNATGASSPPEDNCALTLTLSEGASTFFASVDIGDHGTDVVVEGIYAYLTTGKIAEGLAISNIADPNNPYLITNLDIGGKGRYLYKSGNYLYIGVESSTKGLAIVDVSNVNAPVLKSQTNVSSQGNQTFVVGNYLYMGTESSTKGFTIYDISNPSSPVKKSELNVGGKVLAVQVSGNYAYIGTGNSSKEFQIVDISSPTAPSVVGYLNLSSNVRALDLNGVTAYLGLATATNGFVTVNIANPASPSSLGTVNIGYEIQDLGVLENYVYLALDTEGTGLGVMNIVSPTAPFLSYVQNVEGKGTGVSIDGSYVYISLDTSNKGLVLTGAASVSVASSGNYLSTIYDTGSVDTRYNYLSWSATVVSGSTVTLQLRTASTSAGIASATFVGPDGTSGTYYTTSPTQIVLSPSSTGPRYVQVKVFFTSDTVNSPALDYFTIDYHP
jgi:type II secretory pathway pseudopilin PulG